MYVQRRDLSRAIALFQISSSVNPRLNLPLITFRLPQISQSYRSLSTLSPIPERVGSFGAITITK